ncbi:MAG TPA: ABC transporter permease [Bryobacteraceae bacterium]|nr:ABC transporter permease [Bryobacteraceae bacterium]
MEMRHFTQNPAFSLVAILTLAAGIGANTAIFTVANALLLRPLAFSDPAQLVVINGLPKDRHNLGGTLSYPFFGYLENYQRSFRNVAACTFENFNLTGRGDAEQIRAARVSWNFFDLLGVKPALGRAFRPEEDRRGGPQVVLISDEFWTRKFARNRAAIGQTLDLNGDVFTIIGVLPPQFRFPMSGLDGSDLWTTRVFDLSYVTPARVQAGGPYFHLIGRLARGVSRERAQSEIAVLYDQYRRDHPGAYDSTLDLEMSLGDLRQEFVGNVRPLVLVLSAAVGFVLLIACANVASLLLARAVGRKKEFAIRSALGAPRRVLIRQLLGESLALSLVSGALGIFLGEMGTRALSGLSEPTFPQIAGVEMDARVLLFTLLISLASGILFGLAPALELSKPDLNSMLREEGRTSSGSRGRTRARSVLVVGQVALSMILLVGSGLLIRSFIRLREASPGFDPKNLLTLDITLPPAKYAKTADLIAFYDNVLRRVSATPGVQSAALSTALPAEPNHQAPVLFEGQPQVVLGRRPIVFIQQLSPNYAKTLAISLVAGRTFTAHDDARAPLVAMVNETTARRFWPNENAVGKRIWVGNLPNPFEITGVLGDVKNASLALAPQPEIYLPLPQLTSTYLALSVRTTMDPHGVINSVRREIAAVDPNQPLTQAMTGEELLERTSAQPRFAMVLLAVFAITALLLAIIGVYGIVAFSVAQRTQELGIRLALGAAYADIFRLVIGGALSLTLAGIAIGLAGSLALTRVLSTMLYETSATDPLTFTASGALFVAVAALAGYVPARRATRIDPAQALHE